MERLENLDNQKYKVVKAGSSLMLLCDIAPILFRVCVYTAHTPPLNEEVGISW